jgi:hypothetical protein
MIGFAEWTTLDVMTIRDDILKGIKNKDTAAVDFFFGEMLFVSEGSNNLFTIGDGSVFIVVSFNLGGFLETIDTIKDIGIGNVFIGGLRVIFTEFKTLFEGTPEIVVEEAIFADAVVVEAFVNHGAITISKITKQETVVFGDSVIIKTEMILVNDVGAIHDGGVGNGISKDSEETSWRKGLAIGLGAEQITIFVNKIDVGSTEVIFTALE